MALPRSAKAGVGPPRPTSRPGRVSRALVGLVVAVSLVVSLAGHTPLGAAAASWFVLTPETFSGLQLTALVTNAFVNLSEHPGALFMPILLLALFRMRDLPMLIQRQWKTLLMWFLGLLVGGYLVNRYLVPGVWGILGAVLITGLMAPTVERMFGPRPFVAFCIRVMLVTHLVGATLLWLWPGSVAALFAPVAASPAGIGPLTGAWFLTFALVMDRRTLDGLDIAINGRALAWVLVVLDVYHLLFSGFLSGLMDLIGLGLAWANIHGIGSPSHLLDRFRLWRLERRRARFRVVRGGGDDGRIVH
jgi:hypothetical protein